MRISLDRIRFKNILLFGNNVQEVELKSGLNVIVGKFPGRTNSNKAGKSSFTDVISFALYGRVLKNLRQDQIINWRNKKNCWAEIDFTKGNDKYTIKRGLKPNVIEVIKNGVPVPFVGKRDIQKEIEDDILGINFNTFTNLVYTNINYSVPLLKMKTPQKRLFMENLFGLETFTKLSASCINKLNSIEKKIAKFNNEIKINVAVMKEHESHIQELSVDNNQELLKRLNRVSGDLSAFEEVSIEDINAALYNEREILSKTQLIHNNISSKLEIYKVKEKHLREISDSQGSIESSHTKLKQKIKDHKTLIGEHDTAEDIESKINDVKKKRDKLESRAEVINNNIVSTSSLRDSKLKDLETLRSDDTCPLCRRTIDDYMIYVIIEREVEAFNDELKRFTSDIKVVLTQINDCRVKIEALGAECKSVIELHTSLESLSKQLSTIESMRGGKAVGLGKKIIAYYRVNNILAKYKEIYSKNILEHESNILEYNNILDNYNKNNELLEEKRRLEYHIEYNKKQQSATNKRIKEIKTQIADLTNKNINLQSEIDKLYKLTDYLSYIKDLCKDDKIKQYAVSSIVPYLNKKTNEYLSSIGYNFYIELDRWIDCVIKGPGIVEGSYAALSGGESRSVDIALMMAFHSIARLSSPTYFDIIILDELLDSSIDSSSISSVIDIIKNKQAEDNLKMFIVTHRQEINDIIEFDNTYIVERDQGYSKVRLAE